MRHVLSVVTFCCALAIASPSNAALIDIGSISLVDFGAGAQILIENTSGGILFENRPIEDAFTNIVLSVSGLDYTWGRTTEFPEVPDFYPGSPFGLTPEALLPGAGASLLTFDPTLFLIEATVAFSFGNYQVTGGGELLLFDQPISLLVDIPESGPAPVPEPATLLLLSGGLALALGRRAFRRSDPAAR